MEAWVREPLSLHHQEPWLVGTCCLGPWSTCPVEGCTRHLSPSGPVICSPHPTTRASTSSLHSCHFVHGFSCGLRGQPLALCDASDRAYLARAWGGSLGSRERAVGCAEQVPATTLGTQSSPGTPGTKEAQCLAGQLRDPQLGYFTPDLGARPLSTPARRVSRCHDFQEG